MKKLLIPALAIAFFACVSCGSVESKAEAYVEDAFEAMAAGNMTKAYKIDQESAEWLSSLSEEDAEIAKAAAEKKLAELALANPGLKNLGF